MNDRKLPFSTKKGTSSKFIADELGGRKLLAKAEER